MTTTLRPSGPLQRTADGGRSRGYEVCDNSRPVGSVEIASLPSVEAGCGTVRGLRIAESDRRRGRGTVAALAAEEVLRGWGCTQVQVSVPPDATAAARLTTALGYTERSRTMVKHLPEAPPALPDGASARPMTADEFAVWWEEGLQGYARSWAERGLTPAAARAKAEADRSAGLPGGRATPGVRLEVLEYAGEPAGHLYLGRRELLPGEHAAYVYDIEVYGERRGRGHGRALMLHAERCALAAGERRIGLHVFAGNEPALGLYASLGYRTTAVHSFKHLL
ncbi:GNAT family N-acetyltransferase [Streptomyces sp. NPDC001985]|uniref:GNAT family N-acetyltransferase n=1 Tax=Streptomyces sp. NPDC001985 TaxID=3154406 RepID=UPI00332C77E9